MRKSPRNLFKKFRKSGRISKFNLQFFSLYSLDPSGTYVQCDAKAIGSGAEGAQSSLGDIYHKDITLAEATKQALIILKQVTVLNLLV